jgi:hypothetical protein
MKSAVVRLPKPVAAVLFDVLLVLDDDVLELIADMQASVPRGGENAC